MFIISFEHFIGGGGSLIHIIKNTFNIIIYPDLYSMETNLPFQTIDYISICIWFILISLSIFLNLVIDCEIFITKTILLGTVSLIKKFKSFFPLRRKKIEKYEEIVTVDNKEEDITKYNELSRSIIGSLNNLDKENEICNTSFNGNFKYSSPLIKRKINQANSSSIKIDFPSTPASRCSTPNYTASRSSTPRLRDRERLDNLDYLNQSIGTPNNSLLRNVIVQKTKYSANKNKF